MVESADNRAFAATWREEKSDAVQGTTFGGTMCWAPRAPSSVRVEHDGFVHIVRCRDCPGCREFERRRLADRLHARYGSPNERARRLQESSLHNISVRKAECETRLLLVRIYAPLERHAAISHALHRRRGLELEPGMYRLGTNSFGVLARAHGRIPCVLRALGLQHRIESLHLRRGRRAWNAVTAGMLVSRDAYGEQVDRYYVRGLPPAERREWQVIRMKPYRSYRRQSSPRAWTVDNLVLVPPEVWRLPRGERRNLMRQAATAVSPEGVARVMQMVREVAAARVMQSSPPASSRPAPARDAIVRQYAHVARVAGVASVSEPSADSDPPSSEKGGYASSGHSPPRASPDEGPAPPAEDNKQRRLERDRRLLAEQLERLRKKIMGGE